MDTVRICEQCQRPLPENAPPGRCPECKAKTAPISEPFTPKMRTVPEAAGLAPYFPQLELLDLLGMGAMGIVYKARQPQLDRLVALKILAMDSAPDPSFAERFNREARALAKLNHPGVVAIYDFGQTGQYYYFLMEFVDGMNLRELIDKQTITPRETLELVVQICTALQYAHDEGVVHRDIKPANILVNKRRQVKIADFGLAKLLGNSTDTALTSMYTTMGTLNYMAPEQRENAQGVDHRADIFSLGVVFYEMLTGEIPMGRFEAPSKKVEVDERLDEVVLRALEREPERRYQCASELRSKVETITRIPAVLAGKWRRSPLWAVLGAASMLGFALWLTPHPPAFLDFLTKPGSERLVARAKEQLERYDLPGRIDNAIGDLRRAKGLEANYTDAYAWLGFAYWRRYNSSTLKEDRFYALSYSSNALAYNRECPTAWFVQGLLAQDEDRLNDAVNSLGHANTNFEWENGEVLIQLAKVYWELKDTNKSQSFAQKADKVRNKPWYFFNGMGDYEFRFVHDYPAAETNFQEATRLASDSPKAWANLGLVILAQGGRDAKALACIQKAMSKAPTDEVYFARAQYYMTTDDFAAAARDFLAADGLNTNRYWLGHAGIALLYVPERQAEAKQYLSKALDKVQSRLKDTRDPMAVANLGLFQASLGQTEEAYDTLRQALGSYPDSPQVAGSIETAAGILKRAYHNSSEAKRFRELLPKTEDQK